MAAVGPRLWCGTKSGHIRVLQTGGVLLQWRAHSEAVVAIVPCATRVYTLSEDGSMKGWSSDLPGPYLESCRCVHIVIPTLTRGSDRMSDLDTRCNL